jgi:hypothetical protein
VQKFKVRLKGFRFLAFVPLGKPLATDDQGVATEPVGLDALVPVRGAAQVPADWLIVEAKNLVEAEREFKKAHGIRKALAPFVVEPLGK